MRSLCHLARLNLRVASERGEINGGKVLVYGDGQKVIMGNAAEVKAFEGYVAQKDCVPPSKAGLRKFHNQNSTL